MTGTSKAAGPEAAWKRDQSAEINGAVPSQYVVT